MMNMECPISPIRPARARPAPKRPTRRAAFPMTTFQHGLLAGLR
jgi:hypothetical protein